MDVAVVITLFNGAKWIRQTLESVFSQEKSPVEVIVVDDGSEDGSPDMVRAFSGVTLLRNPGKGENSACSFGFKHTQAPLVTFLDCDDIWHPAHLRLLSTILEEHPECPAAIASCCRFKSDSDLVFSPAKLDAVPFDPWKNFPANEISTNSAVLIRRTAFDAIGGWHTRFGGVGDFYTWLRLSTAQPLILNRSATLGYRQHETSLSMVLRSQQVQSYLNDKIAASEDALAYRLAVCPQDADRTKRQLAVLMPMSDILSAAINLDCKHLKDSTLALEESLAGETSAFVQFILGTLVWYLSPSLCVNIPERKTKILEILLSCWSKEARNTRQALETIKINIPIGIFLQYMRDRPWQISRWGVVADAVRLKLPYYLKERGFFT